jgi:methylphosphotriester-DNA--protein-cysteine methyltransferase
MFEVLVNFGDPYRLIEGNGVERLAGAWVGGILSRAQVLEQPPRQNVLGIRLRPAGAYAVLGVPLCEVSDIQVGLGEVVGTAGDELAESCHAATTVVDRFRVAMRWVALRAARAAAADPAIDWSAAAIVRSAGTVPIAALREKTGLSKTRLAAAFRQQVGAAPKLYARVVRFHGVTRLLRTGAGSLADVALAAGFYDQPHMNAEFRQLGGLAPNRYLAARHPVGDGNTVADL